MNVFGNSSKQLLQALIANAEKETMDYVLQEIQAVLGEEMPEADEVRTYLQDPDKPTELSTTQRIVAMDKLLECAEVNLRKIIKRRRVVMNQSEMMQIILQEFYRIAEIPRPSHHEEKIGDYLMHWAGSHGLSAVRDELGDVIIDKPASAGYEKAPKVILQAHMDMVCVAAEGVHFDPLNDPIKIINDGKTLRADGTSLGADDGIGMALCLYILQDTTLRHGPLRVIITVNEEDGMASVDMPAEYLDGDYLINLDWEWLGSLCNSAAGCDFIRFTRKTSREPAPTDYDTLKVTLKGLQGGHSGVGINLGRANALVCLASAFLRLAEADIPVRISAFSGGQAKNAIPASAQAEILVPKAETAKAVHLLEAYRQDFSIAFGEKEPAYQYTVEAVAPVQQALDGGTSLDLLKLLACLPNGVNTMSPFVPALVESSQNLGLLTLEQDQIVLEAMERSCVNYRAEEILRASRLIGESLGFTYIQGDHAPAWGVNPRSRLVPLTCEVYKEITGQDMVVEPVHGGLECGAFFEKNPHLDMIAIGPSLTDVHSPDESCDIESIQVTAALITRILERLT